VGGLNTAAQNLSSHQEQLPIPQDAAHAVIQAHSQGVELTPGQFRDAIDKADDADSWYSGFTDLGESWFHDQTDAAKNIYQALNRQYGVTAAATPESTATPALVNAAGPMAGLDTTPAAPTIPIPPLPPAGNGDDNGPANPDFSDLTTKAPTFGSGSGSIGRLAGAGGLGGLGSGGLGSGLGDTGAKFGTPVSLATAIPGGLGGAGGLSGGMGAGGGHGAGGHGGESSSTTWLIEDEDPWGGDDVPPDVLR
jgi:hypothetical protein